MFGTFQERRGDSGENKCSIQEPRIAPVLPHPRNVKHVDAYLIILTGIRSAFVHDGPHRTPAHLENNRSIRSEQKDGAPPESIVVISIAMFL